jgi:hypothetical protein
MSKNGSQKDLSMGVPVSKFRRRRQRKDRRDGISPFVRRHLAPADALAFQGRGSLAYERELKSIEVPNLRYSST